MDNQHRHIKGYRELTQVEIDFMNRIKSQGEQLNALIQSVNEHLYKQSAAAPMIDPSFDQNGPDAEDVSTIDNAKRAERIRLNKATPGRWVAISTTHFQEGLMALTRAIAQPTTF